MPAHNSLDCGTNCGRAVTTPPTAETVLSGLSWFMPRPFYRDPSDTHGKENGRTKERSGDEIAGAIRLCTIRGHVHGDEQHDDRAMGGA